MAARMSHPPGRRPARRASSSARRRLVVLGALGLTLALTLAVAIGGLGHPGKARRSAPARIGIVGPDGRVVASIAVDGATSASVRRILAMRLPPAATVRRGRAELTIRYDVPATVGRVSDSQWAGGMVRAVYTTVAAQTPAPVLRQAQRNTCESAALQILLATTGRRVDQRRIQRAFPRSGPLDPAGLGSTDMIWGDPDRGYVGRPDGGGVAGGFGIYPGPVRTTARRFGAALTDLSGQTPASVYRSLLRGRAVMAWVGLSDGPYGTWTTPQRRRVKVNYGEHTVVLHGIDADGALLVSNPLEGTSERWSREQFQTLWARLGNRALATR